MAELATIARPYAEALFKAAGAGDLEALTAQINALAGVAGDAQLRQFADNPKIGADQVFEVMTAAVESPLRFYRVPTMPTGIPFLPSTTR